jgi:hypothetical protein
MQNIFLLNTEPNCRIHFFLFFFYLFLFVCFLFVCLFLFTLYTLSDSWITYNNHIIQQILHDKQICQKRNATPLEQPPKSKPFFFVKYRTKLSYTFFFIFFYLFLFVCFLFVCLFLFSFCFFFTTYIVPIHI